MIIIGIDPGASGGIAMLDDTVETPAVDASVTGHDQVIIPGPRRTAKVVVTVHRMPETERDLLDLLKTLDGQDVKAYLEKVHASPGMGVVAAFSFGGNYRMIRTALIAREIPFDEVTPQVWQKAIGGLVSSTKVAKPSKTDVHNRKVFKKRDKNVSKRRAQELFPTVSKMIHAFADALLIAEYGRRVERGMLARPPASKD